MLKEIYKLGELELVKKAREQEREKHPLIDLYAMLIVSTVAVVLRKSNMRMS